MAATGPLRRGEMAAETAAVPRGDGAVGLDSTARGGVAATLEGAGGLGRAVGFAFGLAGGLGFATGLGVATGFGLATGAALGVATGLGIAATGARDMALGLATASFFIASSGRV